VRLVRAPGLERPSNELSRRLIAVDASPVAAIGYVADAIRWHWPTFASFRNRPFDRTYDRT